MRGIRVYIVDDDPEVCRSMDFLLNTLKLRSRSFADGDSFLEAAGGLAPGCILLDLALPRSSGVAVQAELNRRGNPLPVIAMTGAHDVDAERQALAQGAVSVLHKPFSVESLVAALDQCALRIDRGMSQETTAGCA